MNMEIKDKTLPPVRVTEDQESIIKAAAKKKDRKLADWIRKCTVDASKKVTNQTKGESK